MKYLKSFKEAYTGYLRKKVLNIGNKKKGHCDGGTTGHCSGKEDNENIEKDELEK